MAKIKYFKQQLILMIIALLYPALACAVSDDITFRPIYRDIAAGEIQQFFQDDKGFMWIGGRNSLLRYNAYEFKEIFIEEGEENNPQQSRPQFTTDIFQDTDGKLWVSCHSGLFWFDTAREVLKKAKPVNGLEEPSYSENTHAIAELPSGKLIIGLNDGFALVDKTTLTAERHYLNNYIRDFEGNTVYNIIIDKAQRVWFGARTGLFLYNYTDHHISHFIPDADHPKSQVDNSLWSLGLDKDGMIWGGTLGAGLYIFNPQTQEFKRIRSGTEGSRGLKEDSIWEIMRDSKDAMWLGHDRNGFSKYDAEKAQFKTYTYTLDQPGSLLFNAVRTFYEDNNGDIWIGHYPGGISFHDNSSAAIKVYRPNYSSPTSIGNPNIQAVNEDRTGNLWLAVGDGVDYFDRNADTFKHYRKNMGNYPANGTLSGYIDHQDQIWVGTWTEGYHKYNPTTDQFESMPVDPSQANNQQRQNPILTDATIWGFCETRDGQLWIGTHYAGINRFDAKSKSFTKYNQNNNETSLANNIAWACFEDSKGRFWVGTAWGLSLMNRSDETFKNYRPKKGVANQFQSGSVMSIFEDNDGQMWFGTDLGLYLYREETDDFKEFNSSIGLANDGIRAITGDLDGNLWLGTNSGLIKFDPKTYAVKNYLEHAGQKFSSVNIGAALTSKTGEVIFGSVEGLIIIDPQRLSINTLPPPVVFTDFKIFTKSVPINGPDNLLAAVINNTESITLDYTKGMFSFEFSALSYRNPKKNQYAYKLDGFDQEWREIGTERKAQYTNLGAGHYVFRVRASNNDGVWNQEGTSVNIYQLPPPWQTWWAYTIYLLCLISAATYFVYSQRQKRRAIEIQNRILEKKVAERTKDLAEKNINIQSMLSNMRQGLFTIDESGTIHNEYSAFLKSIYETEYIAGVNAMELMFTGAKLNNDTIDQIDASLFSIIGMDVMNFEFNSHLLLREYQVKISHTTKILSLDWNPILDGDIVCKIMVSVRDITKLKALESEAAGKKRQLDIIGQLLNVNAKKYNNFYNTTKQYLVECRALVEGSESIDDAIVASLFRNMHTIKGNSRTQDFTYIANAAHNTESVYAKLKRNEVAWNKDKLLQDLDCVSAALEEYDSTYKEVLGREDDKARGDDGVWINRKTLDSIQDNIAKFASYDPSAYRMTTTLINRCLAAPLQEVLSGIVISLPSISDELGKDHPNVEFLNHSILVKEEAQNLICDVFSHLLRNAIDHGIETANERESRNKSRQGNIKIEATDQPDKIEISIQDDGCGLNLKRLYKKGLECGTWSETDKVTVGNIAELIFESGMSTKEVVSDISGRGVGMDAVRQFLLQAGGNIVLQMESSSQTYDVDISEDRVSFKTCLSLPKNLFIIDDQASI